MTSMIPRLCPACIYWDPNDDTCTAFPGGVPMSIMMGGDHRQSIPGDDGVVFRKKYGEQAEQELELWKKTFGPDGALPAPTVR